MSRAKIIPIIIVFLACFCFLLDLKDAAYMNMLLAIFLMVLEL